MNDQPATPGRTVGLVATFTFLIGLGVGWIGRPLMTSVASAEEAPVAPRAAAQPERAADESPALAAVPDGGPARAAVDGPARDEADGQLEQWIRAVRTSAADTSASRGTESIRGVVIDEQGGPMEGVIVRASGPFEKHTNVPAPLDPRQFGTAAGPDLQGDLTRQAAWTARALRPAVTATSDDAGAFVLGSLSAGTYQVSARAEDVLFEFSQRAATGTEVSLVGTRVRRLVLDPRLPNGEQPAEAISFTLGNQRQSRAFTWTPEAPELPVTGQVSTFRMVAGACRPVGNAEWVGEFASRVMSVDMHSAGEDPVRIDLEAVTALWVEVETEGQIKGVFGRGQEVRVTLTERASGERILLDDAGTSSFLAKDLRPGLFDLAVGRGSGDPEQSREVLIEPGWNEVAVALGAPDEGRYLIFECRTEEGAPVADMFSVGYRAKTGRSSRSGSVLSGPRNGCEYWVDLGEVSPDTGGVIDSLVVIFTSPSMGNLSLDIAPEPARIKVEFPAPAHLVIELRGPRVEGMYVTIDTWDADSQTWRSVAQRLEVPPSGDIVAGPVSPGRSRVELISTESSRRRTPVASEEFDLAAGPQRVVISSKPLHDLEVFVPERFRDMRIQLLQDRVNGELQNAAGPRVDAEGRLQYKGLLAGRYWLQATESVTIHEMAIDVPSPPVTFTPIEPSGYEVLDVPAGSLAEQAGLRVGDVILSIDDISADDLRFAFLMATAVRDGEAVIQVRRGQASVALPLTLETMPRGIPRGLGAALQPVE